MNNESNKTEFCKFFAIIQPYYTPALTNLTQIIHSVINNSAINEEVVVVVGLVVQDNEISICLRWLNVTMLEYTGVTARPFHEIICLLEVVTGL